MMTQTKKLTSGPAARKLDCSVVQLQRLANSAVIPCELIEVSPGRVMRVFDEADIDEYLAGKQAKAALKKKSEATRAA